MLDLTLDKRKWKEYLKTRGSPTAASNSIFTPITYSPKRVISDISHPILQTSSTSDSASNFDLSPLFGIPKSQSHHSTPLNHNKSNINDNLNHSFANIIKDKPVEKELSYDKSDIIQTTPSSNLETKDKGEICFVCNESLSLVLENEKVLNLHCSDSIHEQCFKTYIKSKNICKILDTFIILNKLCFGKNCNSLNKKLMIHIDNIDLIHDVKSKKEINNSTKIDSKSPLRNALRSTIDESLLSNKRNSSYMISRSPSPDPTMSINEEDIIDDEEIDHSRNNLIKFLLDNCTNINYTDLLTLGKLRIADKLMIKLSSSEELSNKFIYLFDNFIIIWEFGRRCRLIPLKHITISCKESILKICFNNSIIIIHDQNSKVIEKWIIALNDFKLEFPNITSTIDTTERDNTDDAMTIKSESNTDISNDSDTDIDSDIELIQAALQNRKQSSNSSWQELIIELNKAINI